MNRFISLGMAFTLAIATATGCATEQTDDEQIGDDTSETGDAIRGEPTLLPIGGVVSCSAKIGSKTLTGQGLLKAGGGTDLSWNGCYQLEYHETVAGSLQKVEPILYEYRYDGQGARHGVKVLADTSGTVGRGEYKETLTPVSKSGCKSYKESCTHVRRAYAFKFTLKSGSTTTTCTTPPRAFSRIPPTVPQTLKLGADQKSCQ